MENNNLVKAAAFVILAPVVVGATITLINSGIAIANSIRTKHFNKKIEKGLKDGSIVEIDGKYYEVEKVVEEA